MLISPFPIAADTASDLQLQQAVAKGDLGAVRISIANGANIESRNDQGATPLIVAVEKDNLEIVKLLLENGANISAKDNYEETALIEAARSMNPNLMRLLLNAKPTLQEKNDALFEAVRSGPVVIEMSVPGEKKPQNMKTRPELPEVTVTQLLLESGASLESRDQDGETPLMVAADHGQTDTFNLLLQRGAKINVRDRQGMTPLIGAACSCAVATMNSTYDIMESLLEKGADVNARAKDGRTALMMSAGSPDSAASVALLLRYRADVTLKDSKGNTALSIALESRNPDKVRMLRIAMNKAR